MAAAPQGRGGEPPLGPDRRAPCECRGRTLIQLAQIVPDIPTFSVDDGFAYRVPEGLDLDIGAVVRVPLGGRRVRGFVVGLRTVGAEQAPPRLKDVAARSGTLPVFDTRMLETLRWAAIHYVGPLATVLGRCAPPNVPRGPGRSAGIDRVDDLPASPLAEVTQAALAGRHLRPTAWVGPGPWHDAIADVVGPVLQASRSVVVVLPTAAEAEAMTDHLGRRFPGRVVSGGSALPARAVTDAWARAATIPGLIAVGTRETALWHVAGLSLAFIVEEGRRAMKSPQTPTLHVREVLRRRAAVERFPLVVAGAVPTSETLAAGAEIRRVAGRAWRLVEVVDRREDPDPAAVVSDRVRNAVRSVERRGGTVLALVHRRGYAPAFRCVRCGEIRRCSACGSAVDRDGSCRRCGQSAGACGACGGEHFAPLGAGVGRIVDDLRRSVGESVGPVGSGRPVQVGTERDLVNVSLVDLAVLVDVDSWLLAPHYRAEEDALRIVGRVANRVRPGSGRRAMVQTAQPEHRVMQAARHGDPVELLEHLVDERASAGFPPAGDVIAVELSDAGPDADAELRAVVGENGTVHGPGETRAGLRWIVQGSSLRAVRVRLRPQVQLWRDAGTRVRIDADPIDL